MNFAPLRGFGFRLGASGIAIVSGVSRAGGVGSTGAAGGSVFGRIGASLARSARLGTDLLRHLPEEFARSGTGRERVHVTGVAGIALGTFGFFSRSQTL